MDRTVVTRMVRINASGICLFLGILLIISGCATTIQKRDVAASGFLGDYSQLKEGKEDQALMVYRDQDVNFDSYDNMIIDPVRILISDDSDMAKISAEDRQKIADYFHAVLTENLKKNYQIVSRPGPKTLRLRFALTDITGSGVVMDTVSTILPIGLAVDVIAYAATGNHTYVGGANAEMEILDSETGKRLAAAVDGRSGRKITGRMDKFGKWKDTKDACDYWAERIARRLDEISYSDYIIKGH